MKSVEIEIPPGVSTVRVRFHRSDSYSVTVSYCDTRGNWFMDRTLLVGGAIETTNGIPDEVAKIAPPRPKKVAWEFLGPPPTGGK